MNVLIQKKNESKSFWSPKENKKNINNSVNKKYIWRIIYLLDKLNRE
jgi:hypothetical protein